MSTALRQTLYDLGIADIRIKKGPKRWIVEALMEDGRVRTTAVNVSHMSDAQMVTACGSAIYRQVKEET